MLFRFPVNLKKRFKSKCVSALLLNGQAQTAILSCNSITSEESNFELLAMYNSFSCDWVTMRTAKISPSTSTSALFFHIIARSENPPIIVYHDKYCISFHILRILNIKYLYSETQPQ